VAVSYVGALIGLARKVRAAKPWLWEYALRLRDKRFAATLVDEVAMQPVLHVSQRYPAARMCAAAVLPLARHPRVDNRVIVFDLDGDPQALLDLEPEAIAARLYLRKEQLAEGEQRIPLKEVHLNRCPALVAWSHLREADFERLSLDRGMVEARAARLRAIGPMLAEKVRRVFAIEEQRPPSDPDASLYDGFLSDADRRRCQQVRATPPRAMAGHDFGFGDPRLAELLFRYRARNWPELLDGAERERWEGWRRSRLQAGAGLADPDVGMFDSELAALRLRHAEDPARLGLLDALDAWRSRILP
jgi:exodeoxyribonuclease-1